MYHCMNFVTEPDGEAGAVLIRAAEPVTGFAEAPPAARLMSGPGKLCRALGITLAHRGLDLTATGSALVVCDDGTPAPRRARSARIGVDYAGAWSERLLRFYVPTSASVSGPRRPR
ncbi:MAG TPA: DNA-3-methyladenine glycosylase [Polyangia bacterium]